MRRASSLVGGRGIQHTLRDEEHTNVEELPGANTQGTTIEEARENLQEAAELVLEANRVLPEESLEGQKVVRGSLPVA